MAKNWNQPMCERCWIDAEGEFDMTTLPGGDVGQRLVSLRIPARLSEVQIENCAWCGHLTISGIYKRIDPNYVNFPKAAIDD